MSNTIDVEIQSLISPDVLLLLGEPAVMQKRMETLTALFWQGSPNWWSQGICRMAVGQGLDRLLMRNFRASSDEDAVIA